MSNFPAIEPTASQITSPWLKNYCGPTRADFTIQNLDSQPSGQPLCSSLFQNKTCQHLSALLEPLIEQDTSPLHPGFSTCSQNTNVLPISQESINGISDEVLIQHDFRHHHNCTTTSQACALNAFHHDKTVDSMPFGDPLHETMTFEIFPNGLHEELPLKQSNAIPQEQEKHVVDVPNRNNLVDTGCSTNSLDCLRNQSQPIIYKAGISSLTFKQTAPSINKKEMRARRNRESARRSRMKSKQHFQALERTLVFMNKENTALRLLVAKLLSKCVETSPLMRERLQSVFEEKL